MLQIGSLYEFGQGVEQDYSQSIEWYKKAADKGKTTALRDIGSMYEIGGYGIEKNEQLAAEYKAKYEAAKNAAGKE